VSRLSCAGFSLLRICAKRTWCVLLTIGLLAACAAPSEEPVEPPQVLTDSVPFIYPLELWDHNISGQTVLLLLVNATGQVDSVTIDSPSGYAEFDSAAVQGAHRLRFIAARQGDRRIPMWTKVPVRFSRDTTKLGIGGT
jgi:protein TonB